MGKFVFEKYINSGFTLVELMVVLGIIAVITVAGAVSFTKVSQNSRDTKREADIKLIENGLEQYHDDQGYYPSTAQFNASTSLSASGKVYIQTIPIDPKSGSKYRYIGQPNTPTPCDNSTVAKRCTTFCLATQLEGQVAGTACDGAGENFYVGNPIIFVPTNTLTPTLSPTRTPTPTYTPTPTPTRTPTPTLTPSPTPVPPPPPPPVCYNNPGVDCYCFSCCCGWVYNGSQNVCICGSTGPINACGCY